MIFWLTLLTLTVVIEGFIIRDCIERLDAFESWYPFCEFMKMKLHEEEENEERHDI